MHVCCIGNFNIPIFTCTIPFPFNSNKGESEEKKKSVTLLLPLMHLSLKAHGLVETSFPCVGKDINGGVRTILHCACL